MNLAFPDKTKLVLSELRKPKVAAAVTVVAIGYLSLLISYWSFWATVGFTFLLALFVVAKFDDGKVVKDFRHNYMKKFAELNGFEFMSSLLSLPSPPIKADGFVFSIGSDAFAKHVISGKLESFDFSFFNYIFRKRGVNKITVLEIKTDQELPYMLLDSHASGKGVFYSHGLIPETKQVRLEGDFGDYFNFYIDEGTQIHALQIFSPEVMDVLIKNSQEFDIEFSGKTITIYKKGHPLRNNDIRQMFTVASKLLGELERIYRIFGNTKSQVPSGSRFLEESKEKHYLRQKKYILIAAIIIIALFLFFIFN